MFYIFKISKITVLYLIIMSYNFLECVIKLDFYIMNGKFATLNIILNE